jgi:VanZ family protein
MKPTEPAEGRSTCGARRTVLRRLLWYWLPALAWMGMIFVLSAQSDLPGPAEPWMDALVKKGGHAVGYGVLAWLYERALRGRVRGPVALRVATVSLALAYALSDEYHQTFVPGRSGSLVDAGIDSTGICGAMLLSGWLERRRARRLPPQRSVAR